MPSASQSPFSLQKELLPPKSSLWTVAVFPQERGTLGKVWLPRKADVAYGMVLVQGRTERVLTECGQLKERTYLGSACPR